VTAAVTAALAELRRRDPVIDRLAETHGPPRVPGRRPAGERFGALVRSITYQQLAGAAASTIHRRVVEALGGEVTPDRVLATPPETLRAAGLSANKLASILDLAAKVDSGQVALTRIGRLGDDDVVDHLVSVRGIGRWTAEMFLISNLGRLDVWPVDDLGVRVGFGRAWGLEVAPPPKTLAGLGDRYRPYRTLVAWYCWRVADQRPPPVTV
jgi:3-methyladenine DNA glycosylase/8-oxoguanine DNA glycosylase